jgi:predicted RecB family nuclease
MPEHWVMNLTGIGQNTLNELKAMGIEDIRDLPETFPLSEIQKRIKKCVKNNKEHLSKDLKDELNDMEYPLHFLDFETLGPAIPRYTGTRPYQTIPFQWSDHILYEDGTIEHREYLCEEDTDPREAFTLSLLQALGVKGSVVTYTSYEEGILRDLAKELTEYRDQLHALLYRIKDLHQIIRKHYYHPGFHGSFSLKSVLPAILPEMSYENLEIQEGQMASLEYVKMMDPATPIEEKEKIKRDLLTYCGHDTRAMLKIREMLISRF